MKGIIVNNEIYKIIENPNKLCDDCALYEYCKHFDNDKIPGCLADILGNIDIDFKNSFKFEKA